MNLVSREGQSGGDMVLGGGVETNKMIAAR